MYNIADQISIITRMKRFTIFLILILITSFPLQSQVVLKIEISKLKNNSGVVLLELRDAEKNLIKGISEKIKGNGCRITIDKLSPGRYTFRYFHDENNNKKIDANWMGMPKEGYGFSNNAKGTFGPPSYKNMIFKLNGDTTLNCTPVYIK